MDNYALSEFLGALAGDGCIAKNSSKIELTMHPVKDVSYLTEFMAPLIRKLFGDVSLFFQIRQRAARLFFNSKQIKIYLCNLGFPQGKKGDFEVMQFIKENKELWPHFIRGFFDTDGCIFWDPRKIYLKPYPRVCLYTISEKLVRDLYKFTTELGLITSIRYRQNRPAKTLETYGYENLKRWLSVIGSSNHWKRDSLCLDSSVVESKAEMLSLQRSLGIENQ